MPYGACRIPWRQADGSAGGLYWADGAARGQAGTLRGPAASLLDAIGRAPNAKRPIA
ncbi:hypothetical protein [Lysobacter humi (ex Lee et al. 2017)]